MFTNVCDISYDLYKTTIAFLTCLCMYKAVAAWERNEKFIYVEKGSSETLIPVQFIRNISTLSVKPHSVSKPSKFSRSIRYTLIGTGDKKV